MKLKTIFLSLLCMAMAVVYAAPVSPSTAQQVACNFWSINAGKTISVNLVDVSEQAGFQELFVFVHPQGKGYVIVSADDCVQPIIGYSLNSGFEFPLPRHVQAYLQGFEEEIVYYKSVGVRATAEISELWQSMRNGSYTPRNTTSVSPMLTTTWSQRPYYNDLCPDSAGVHAVAGCVAIATAQVMKFWNWPLTGTGSHTYTDDQPGSYNFGTLTANFGATTYNWSSMPNALNNLSTPAEVNAVATLVYHVGVAVEMDYGVNESGAYTNSNYISDLPCSENALKDYFRYKNTLYSVYKDEVTDAVWISTLVAELDGGRPVIEAGRGGGGHAFVCDGYDNNGLFHINWGWGSSYDGYFAHNALNPGGGGTGSSSTHTYNDDQKLVVGIEPSGMMYTNTDYLLLPQEGGTASFMVTSNNNNTASWTASSNQSWLTVSPSTGAGSGVLTTVNVTAAANNTGAARQAIVTITQGTQSVTVTVSQCECSTNDMCTITLNMEDSYGDGWNGSYLTLSSSSGYVYGTATVSGDSSATQQFNVCPSGLILTWTSNSSWDYECSFVVNNASGQPLLTVSETPTGTYSITSPCDGGTTCEITTFPWNESFESDIDCWTTIDADNDGNDWILLHNNSYASDGEYSMISYSYLNSTALDVENYLISPKITLPSTGNYQLTFYAQSYSDAYCDSILVKLSPTTNANVSAFTTTLMQKTNAPSAYQQFTVSLAGYNGQSFYLAFVHDSYDRQVLFIDNITIADPSLNYTVTATSANTAMGTVTGGGTYTAGASASLAATAYEGYRFTGWDDGSTDNPLSFSVMGNTSYIASFADLGTGELHYDNGTCVNTMGAGGSFYWAVRFPASVLTSYNTLSSVRIFDANEGSYEVRVYQGGTDAPSSTLLSSQTFSMSGTFNWYDVVLTNPVTINPAQPLWIVLYNTGVNYPATCSNYAGNPDGSWVSLDGSTWNSICDYGFYYTWMIRPVLSSGSTPPPTQTYTITAVSADNTMGYVTGGGPYTAGSTAQIRAYPYSGYAFVQWQDGNTDNPRTITVTGNATYTAYFQAVSTNCSVSTFPWNESFENGWDCWTTIDADGDGNDWDQLHNPNYAYAGEYSMYSYSFYNSTALDAENYLISPQITLPVTGNYQLTFYARSVNSSYLDSMLVKISTTTNANVSAFTTTLMQKTQIPLDYQQYTISLAGYNGQSFYLAFVHDAYNEVALILDNITIADPSVNYTVTATSANSSMGTVTGGGTYTAGAGATLEATAYEGYRFTGWNDGNTVNPRDITVTGNVTYTASFADLGTGELHYDNGTFATNVGTSTAGSVYWAVRFPASVLSSYNTLSSVRVWDENQGSYSVRVYQGGTDAPETLLRSQDFSMSGTETWYNVALSSPVTINPAQALWIVLYSSDVTYPAAGSTYAGNSDGSWLSMDGVTWGHVFDYGLYYSWMVRPVLSYNSTPPSQNYTITAVSADNTMGYVIGGGSYTAGSTAQLRAYPYSGYAFVQWQDGNTDNPRTITVTGNATYTAYFQSASNNYIVTVTSTNTSMGTVTGGGSYAADAVATLEATAYEGFRFTGWNDGNTANPRDIIVTGNVTYTASFANLGTNELHYDNGTYSSSMGANGSMYWAVRFPASVLSSYTTLSSVRVWDQYAGSYELRVCQGGTDAPSTQVASQTFSMSGAEAWHDVTFSSPVTINPAQPLWIVLYNSGVTYPAAGSDYAGNSDGSWVSTDGTNWIVLNAAGYYYTWMIRPILSSGSTPPPTQTYTITAVSADNSMGYVDGAGPYLAGTTATLRAIPYPGYEFHNWNDGVTDAVRDVLVLSDMSFVAYFQPISGINDNDLSAINVYSHANQIVVSNAEGESIAIYDVLGKLIASDAQNAQANRIFTIPTKGIYLVRVGDTYFKKVIVK